MTAARARDAVWHCYAFTQAGDRCPRRGQHTFEHPESEGGGVSSFCCRHWRKHGECEHGKYPGLNAMAISDGLAPEKVLRVTEKAFMQSVIDLAKVLGWKVFHPFDSRRSEPGWPDLVLVRDWWVLFVELKRESGRLTSAQQEWLMELDECQTKSLVWRPSDWDKVVKTLQGDDTHG